MHPITDSIAPLTPTVAIWVRTAIKHPVPDRVKSSICNFDIGHAECQDVKIANDGLTRSCNSGRQRVMDTHSTLHQ